MFGFVTLLLEILVELFNAYPAIPRAANEPNQPLLLMPDQLLVTLKFLLLRNNAGCFICHHGCKCVVKISG